MAKTLQRTLAMASALVITFTASQAYALPSLSELTDYVVTAFVFITTLNLSDVFWGRSPEHTRFIFGMTFTLTWGILQKWKWPMWAHVVTLMGSYLASMITGLFFEAFRSSSFAGAMKLATFMTYGMWGFAFFALVSQYTVLWNWGTVTKHMRLVGFLTFPLYRVVPPELLGEPSATPRITTPQPTPAPVPRPDEGPAPTPGPEPGPEEGQAPDTPLLTDDDRLAPLRTLRGARESSPQENRPRAISPICGCLTEVGSTHCMACGKEQLPELATKACLEVICLECGKKVEASKFCMKCGELLDLTTREEGVSTSHQHDDDMYAS